MKNLEDLEKKINSELNTKINNTEIKHDQIYISINSEDLIDTIMLLKTNEYTKFRQLIDITAVDYPENNQRFKLVYLLLSHENNLRIIIYFKSLSPSQLFQKGFSSPGRYILIVTRGITIFCGCSSVVERQLPKLNAASSNLVIRLPN